MTIRNKLKIKQLLFIQAVVSLFVMGVSCNSKAEDDENEIVVTPAIVAIKSFSIQKNEKVLSNLDSVYFAIDLNTGVIFNADSLPKGTDVSKLVASITFANTMTKAELTFENEDAETVVVDYLTNPTDSIDFTNPVNLNVTAQNGTTNFSYLIKVNVHKTETDTLRWTRLATSPLPSRFEKPVAQKTLFHDGIAYCFVEESNGEYTLSKCEDLNEGRWQKNPVDLGFEFNINSFSDSPDMFWVLDKEGSLYQSNDGLTWTFTGEKWFSILGAYGNIMFGLKQIGEEIYHTAFPPMPDFTETPIEKDFPITASTSLKTIETDWADKPFAFLACGLTETGEFTSAVWAYDGTKWGIINENVLPTLSNPAMVRYVVYRSTSMAFKQRRFDVWMLMGGENQEGDFNRKIYISFNNGVNWQPAPDSMQLPGIFPSLKAMDLIVAGYDLTADLSAAWRNDSSESTRGNYTLDGYDITWVCPYLYVFGGYEPDGMLNDNIWRGVLARLTFMPDI